MVKNEIAAYLITEASVPATISNVNVYDKTGLFYLRFDAVLQEFNVFNRNRRMYMGDAMVESLNAEHILELQSKGSWFGEAGHPDSTDPKRILTIDPKLISHKIISHNATPQKCTGTIETLDSTYGREMTKAILQHMEPAFSLRALAPLVKKADGTSIIKTKSHIVTYDWVVLPSHKGAYRDTSKPIGKICQKIADDGNIVTTESAVLPVHKNMIKEYVIQESYNVKMISNICEVALGNAHVTKDCKNVIVTEGSDTFVIPIEEKIKYDIANYMRKL